MPTELFANIIPASNPCLLAGAVTATVTNWSVTVPVGANLPTTGPTQGQLRALVDQEIVIITGGTALGTDSPQTWTVIRGQEGTIAASHNSTTAVQVEATAGSLSNSVQLSPSSAQTGSISVSGQIQDDLAGYLLPSGWDAGWRAAKLAASSRIITVMTWGGS